MVIFDVTLNFTNEWWFKKLKEPNDIVLLLYTNWYNKIHMIK